ncbi:MAG: SPOR domain-containing protein [Pseudomonadales bacterium]
MPRAGALVLWLALIAGSVAPANALAAAAPASPSAAATAEARVGDQLVFGSFRSPENAASWAARLGALFDHEIVVEEVFAGEGRWYRVRSAALDAPARAQLERQAQAQDVRFWIIHGAVAHADTITSSVPTEESAALIAPGPAAPAPPATPSQRPVPSPGRAEESAFAAAPGSELRPTPRNTPPGRPAERADSDAQVDIDVGLEARTFARTGIEGQDQFQPSLHGSVDYYRSWDDGRQSLTASPFLRLDLQDSQRTHFDLREFYWSLVGDDWDLHLGVKQVFWGVTEFKHLVDIINQTDLVENIDGEDKLGQPMAHLSLVRDWGILDLYALVGFRERTFPGSDGRLRPTLPIDEDDARYESGARWHRVDGAVRYSHHIGPLSFGVHHFSGTSRDPLFVPVQQASGEWVLVPEYRIIDQTGLDAQYLWNDWAFKLEALTRSGMGARYAAANVGFERTLVGVLDTRADLGIVVEYMYDERDERAPDTLFEHDLALGARWSLNDLADTQALFGLIWDVHTEEYVFSLEASRRLGASWNLNLESRLFGGAVTAAAPLPGTAPAIFGEKSAYLQRDDYLQLELVRYF